MGHLPLAMPKTIDCLSPTHKRKIISFRAGLNFAFVVLFGHDKRNDHTRAADRRGGTEPDSRSAGIESGLEPNPSEPRTLRALGLAQRQGPTQRHLPVRTARRQVAARTLLLQ